MLGRAIRSGAGRSGSSTSSRKDPLHATHRGGFQADGAGDGDSSRANCHRPGSPRLRQPCLDGGPTRRHDAGRMLGAGHEPSRPSCSEAAKNDPDMFELVTLTTELMQICNASQESCLDEVRHAAVPRVVVWSKLPRPPRRDPPRIERASLAKPFFDMVVRCFVRRSPWEALRAGRDFRHWKSPNSQRRDCDDFCGAAGSRSGEIAPVPLLSWTARKIVFQKRLA